MFLKVISFQTGVTFEQGVWCSLSCIMDSKPSVQSFCLWRTTVRYSALQRACSWNKSDIL